MIGKPDPMPWGSRDPFVDVATRCIEVVPIKDVGWCDTLECQIQYMPGSLLPRVYAPMGIWPYGLCPWCWGQRWVEWRRGLESPRWYHAAVNSAEERLTVVGRTGAR